MNRNEPADVRIIMRAAVFILCATIVTCALRPTHSAPEPEGEPTEALPGEDMPPAVPFSIENYRQREAQLRPRPHIDLETIQGDESDSHGEEIVKEALKHLGVPYVRGGKRPETGFDCSGFTSYVYGQLGHQISPSSIAQYEAVPSGISQNPAVGDLVFFKINFQRVSHVGIFIGNGKFVHAPRPGKTVEVADFNLTYWKSRFAGARGPVEE